MNSVGQLDCLKLNACLRALLCWGPSCIKQVMGQHQLHSFNKFMPDAICQSRVQFSRLLFQTRCCQNHTRGFADMHAGRVTGRSPGGCSTTVQRWRRWREKLIAGGPHAFPRLCILASGTGDGRPLSHGSFHRCQSVLTRLGLLAH